MIVDHDDDDDDGNENIHNCNYAINDGDDNDRVGTTMMPLMMMIKDGG